MDVSALADSVVSTEAQRGEEISVSPLSAMLSFLQGTCSLPSAA